MRSDVASVQLTSDGDATLFTRDLQGFFMEKIARHFLYFTSDFVNVLLDRYNVRGPVCRTRHSNVDSRQGAEASCIENGMRLPQVLTSDDDLIGNHGW